MKVFRTEFNEEFLARSLNRDRQKDFDEGVIIIGDTYEEIAQEIDRIYETDNLAPISWFSEIVDFPGPEWRAVGQIKRL